MTRVGTFLFHILFITFIYGLLYLNGAKPAAVSYVLINFTLPYLLLLLLMLVIATIRWFMSHEPDIATEAVTWVNLLWSMPILTILALYCIGAVDIHFIDSLRGIFATR